MEIPAIKSIDPENKQNVVDALLSLNSYDWLVFTSVNGVTTFFHYFFTALSGFARLRRRENRRHRPGNRRKIARIAFASGFDAGRIYRTQNRRGICETRKHREFQKSACCARKMRIRELPEALEEMGAIVDDIGIYKTVAETEDFLARRKIFWRAARIGSRSQAARP